MNKIDKYLRRFAYKIETSETKESRYYTIGDLIVRVSNHIGKNSSGLKSPAMNLISVEILKFFIGTENPEVNVRFVPVPLIGYIQQLSS